MVVRWVAILPDRDRFWVLRPDIPNRAYWAVLQSWGRNRRSTRISAVGTASVVFILVLFVVGWSLLGSLQVAGTVGWLLTAALSVTAGVLSGREILVARRWQPPVGTARWAQTARLPRCDAVLWGSPEHIWLWEVTGGQHSVPLTAVPAVVPEEPVGGIPGEDPQQWVA